MLTLALLAGCNCSLQGIKLFRAIQMLRKCQAAVLCCVSATCVCHQACAQLLILYHHLWWTSPGELMATM